jgi:tetratricopeptide (TPR) repeat protein
MRSFLRWAHSLVYVVKGTHALHRGDHEGVVECYTRAIEICEDIDYYHARAKAYRALDEPGLAVADYTQAIELHPRDLYAYFLRASLQRERGFLAQAIADYGRIIEMTDGLASPYVGRSFCYLEEKDYARALADAEAALEIEPENQHAREMRARCLERLKSAASEKEKEKSRDEP